MSRKIIAVVGTSGSGKSVFLNVISSALSQNSLTNGFFYDSCVHCGTVRLSEIDDKLKNGLPLKPTQVGMGFKKDQLIVTEVKARRNKRSLFKWNKLSIFMFSWDLSGESYNRYVSHENIGIYIGQLLKRGREEVHNYLNEVYRYYGDIGKVLQEKPPAIPRVIDPCLESENIDCLCMEYMLKNADGVVLLLDKGFIDSNSFNPFSINNLINKMRMQRGLVLNSQSPRALKVPIAVVFNKDDLYNIGDPLQYALSEPRLDKLAAMLMEKRLAHRLKVFVATNFGYGNVNQANKNTPLNYPLQPEGIREVFDWMIDNI